MLKFNFAFKYVFCTWHFICHIYIMIGCLTLYRRKSFNKISKESIKSEVCEYNRFTLTHKTYFQ